MQPSPSRPWELEGVSIYTRVELSPAGYFRHGRATSCMVWTLVARGMVARSVPSHSCHDDLRYQSPVLLRADGCAASKPRFVKPHRRGLLTRCQCPSPVPSTASIRRSSGWNWTGSWRESKKVEWFCRHSASRYIFSPDHRTVGTTLLSP